MKPNTVLWFRFESVGRPEASQQGQDSVRGIIKQFAEWSLAVYMGSKIRVTLARSEEELNPDRRSAANADILAELDSLIPDETETND